ncbi:BTAD domain-containing putative transcriptional regulator [Kitasatospora sp. NPDC001527]|uniref:AfsR/SARP family transcriptional regulator n=1 Tax=Kitasatospora sp. NPDC001527 TaxID=3154519 RepID=UPI0033220479
MRINLLGRFELQDDHGRVLPLPGPKRRALLAALALELGRTVPAERLGTLLWGGAPPATARSALQSHVTAVRRLLAAAADGTAPPGGIAEDPDGLHLVTRDDGYALLGHPDAVDAHRFERLCAAAGANAADPGGLLRTALALWRGPALDGCGSARLAAEAGPRLTAARWWAVERFAAEALLGRDGVDERIPQAVAELTALLAAEPRRGRAAALLARCLERPAPPADPGAAPEAGRVPGGPGVFVGRAGELARLDAAAATADGRPLLLTGPAGVGKTRLARAWAEHRAGRFPDGRHTLDLHGEDGATALTPAAALARLLRELGAGGDDLPADTAGRAALLRTLTAGRRLLLLLDDARSAEQVEPLLPGHREVLVLVTGRSRLTADLVARQGAVPLPLGAPAPAEAVGLLAAAAGAGRVAREPEAAAPLAALCDQLPFAVGLVGARLAAGGGSAAGLVEELREERRAGADGVTAALAVAWRGLSPEAGRALALTGLLPGSGIDARDLAALGALPPPRARELLAALAAARLVEETGPGRFDRPGAVRRYAVERAAWLPAEERAAALRRLLDQWADTAEAAAEAVGEAVGQADGGGSCAPADQDGPVAWFPRVRRVLTAVARAGAAHGLDPEVWRLAHGCGPLHYHDGAHPEAWEELAREGLAAAERLGDRTARLLLRTDLGLALVCRKRFTEAAGVAEQAVAEAGGAEDAAEDSAEDSAVRDRCLTALAGTLAASGRGYQAIAVLERVVASCEARGDGASTARALDHLAHCLHRVGEAERGLAHTDRALDLVRDRPDDPLQRTLRFSRAEALRLLGRVEEALAAADEALALAEKQDDTRLALLALDFNGALLAGLGRPAEAADHWRRALALHTAEGRPNAALARRLAALEPGA